MEKILAAHNFGKIRSLCRLDYPGILVELEIRIEFRDTQAFKSLINHQFKSDCNGSHNGSQDSARQFFNMKMKLNMKVLIFKPPVVPPSVFTRFGCFQLTLIVLNGTCII